jgi:acetyl-CoA synthetase
MSNEEISNLGSEDRTFAPSPAFTAQANATPDLYDEAASDYEVFWAKQAKALHWEKSWDRILEWNLPFAKWFVGGTLNASYNCIDRHVN